MKNIKNLVLTAMIAISTLSDTVTCAVPFPFSLQTVKNVCKYAVLPIAYNITFNGLLGNTVIQETIKTYKKNGIIISSILFTISVPTKIIELVMAPESPYPHIPTIVVGGLGIATSYAGMRYFDNQIKAQQQLINLNAEKK